MIAFGASSYAVLGMMYFVLTVMLLTSWRGPRIGGYLIGAGIAAASKKRPIINRLSRVSDLPIQVKPHLVPLGLGCGITARISVRVEGRFGHMSLSNQRISLILITPRNSIRLRRSSGSHGAISCGQIASIPPLPMRMHRGVVGCIFATWLRTYFPD